PFLEPAGVGRALLVHCLRAPVLVLRRGFPLSHRPPEHRAGERPASSVPMGLPTTRPSCRCSRMDYHINLGTAGWGVWHSPDAGKSWVRHRKPFPLNSRIQALTVLPGEPRGLLAAGDTG